MDHPILKRFLPDHPIPELYLGKLNRFLEDRPIISLFLKKDKLISASILILIAGVSVEFLRGQPVAALGHFSSIIFLIAGVAVIRFVWMLRGDDPVSVKPLTSGIVLLFFISLI